MAATVEIGTLIDRDPGVRNGVPKIAGTGVTVMSIVARYQTGMTPEEIADSYGHIGVGQVHAALAYYHLNRVEIDSAIAEETALYQRLAADDARAKGLK